MLRRCRADADQDCGPTCGAEEFVSGIRLSSEIRGWVTARILNPSFPPFCSASDRVRLASPTLLQEGRELSSAVRTSVFSSHRAKPQSCRCSACDSLVQSVFCPFGWAWQTRTSCCAALAVQASYSGKASRPGGGMCACTRTCAPDCNVRAM